MNGRETPIFPHIGWARNCWSHLIIKGFRLFKVLCFNYSVMLIVLFIFIIFFLLISWGLILHSSCWFLSFLRWMLSSWAYSFSYIFMTINSLQERFSAYWQFLDMPSFMIIYFKIYSNFLFLYLFWHMGHLEIYCLNIIYVDLSPGFNKIICNLIPHWWENVVYFNFFDIWCNLLYCLLYSLFCAFDNNVCSTTCGCIIKYMWSWSIC